MKSCSRLREIYHENKKACMTIDFYMWFLRALDASMGVHDKYFLLCAIMPFTTRYVTSEDCKHYTLSTKLFKHGTSS